MNNYLLFSFFTIALSIGANARFYSNKYYNVLDHGAKGDGLTNDRQELLKAWETACGATLTDEIPTVTVPAGQTLLLTPVAFNGPCKSPTIQFQVDGTIVAPSDRSGWTDCFENCWIVFSNVDNLVVNGSGTIDGKGSIWWNNSLATSDDPCNKPKALQFVNCNGLQLNGITHKDSPGAHMAILGGSNITISNLHITAPGDSPNTDGIGIYGPNQVQIRDSIIGTGDDCIAIGNGTSFINITGVACGPGHGISIGSLGKDGAIAIVEEVYVKNCSFTGTTNGARIKTWQGGAGHARKITFEDCPLVNVKNPIIIDQFYGTTVSGFGNEQSAVEISDVTYRGFQGSSATEAAINLNCSNDKACSNIVMESISITSSDPSKTVYAACNNAQGKQTSVTPSVPCLT